MSWAAVLLVVALTGGCMSPSGEGANEREPHLPLPRYRPQAHPHGERRLPVGNRL